MYPDLERKHDVNSGINLEAFWAKLWHQGNETNYRSDLEYYEPIHVWIRDTAAIARVHGLEHLDFPRSTETGGEFHTVISFERRADGWQIVQTDEQMLGERAPTDPPAR